VESWVAAEAVGERIRPDRGRPVAELTVSIVLVEGDVATGI